MKRAICGRKGENAHHAQDTSVIALPLELAARSCPPVVSMESGTTSRLETTIVKAVRSTKRLAFSFVSEGAERIGGIVAHGACSHSRNVVTPQECLKLECVDVMMMIKDCLGRCPRSGVKITKIRDPAHTASARISVQ